MKKRIRNKKLKQRRLASLAEQIKATGGFFCLECGEKLSPLNNYHFEKGLCDIGCEFLFTNLGKENYI